MVLHVDLVLAVIMLRGVLAVYLLFSPHSVHATRCTLNKPHTKWVLEHVPAIRRPAITAVEMLQEELDISTDF